MVEMLLSISFAVKDAMLDWEWLGIDEKEWPPQHLDWEMYRIEHLTFASYMEDSMDGWPQQPWHVLYSALRCMSCQDWCKQHVCPTGHIKPMIPSVATLLTALYRNKEPRE